jgi:signal transduction histidine kinase/ligand-binding sensor domain-containing protein
MARIVSPRAFPLCMLAPVLPLRCHSLLLLSALCCCAQESGALREPVHPRRNVDEFPTVEATRIRFTVTETVRGEPCLDELEVYGPDNPEKNLALADHGTVARASGALPDYRIHALRHVNDGRYGNGHSWIADTPGSGWVELELPAVQRIHRVVWSRDREGKFTDRLATKYRIEVATGEGPWRTAASSDDRAPLNLVLVENPVYANSVRRIAPAATDLPGTSRPASREYLLRTWQTADGLPSNTVTALLAARDGWLWVGTTSGLARFDGTRFRVFGETHGLPALSITCLAEDAQGHLWAGTEGGGAARWDGSRFQAVPTGNDHAGNTVLTLAAHADATLWAGTLAGLLEWRDGKFEKRLDGPVVRIAPGNGGLWLISANALRFWTGGALAEVPAELDRSLFSSLSALAAGPDGALWFGGANGYLGKFLDQNVTTLGEGHAVLSSSAWDLLPARNGDVWVGTSASGLGRIRDRALLHLTTDDGLPANTVRAICEDAEGNVWAGTAGGLTRLSPRRVEAITTRDGLSHNAVLSLAEDSAGTVWIGTNGGGLNQLKDGRAAPWAPSFVMENKSIPALCASAGGVLWAGTSDSGLFRLSEGTVGHFGVSEGLPARAVTALCEAPGGGLWLGTLDGGPAYFDGTEATVPPPLEPLKGLPVTAVLTDAEGAVWFGTAGHGAARLSGDSLTRWNRASGLSSDFIRTLRGGADGTVWMGTSNGLVRWRKGALFNFTAACGLPDAFISQILDDEAGHLWLGTNLGVLRVSHESLESVAAGRSASLNVLMLGTGDGLPSLECTGGYHPAGLRLGDGRLCFGTVAGLAVVDPKRFAAASEPPPVVLEESTATPLPAGDAPFEVKFTALHFTAPERLRFRYRLAGLEPAWTDAGSSRTARYSHLPAGEFRFEVIASADGITWSRTPAALPLRVLAPWWRSPWSYGLAGLTALAAVAGSVRLVTRRRLQRRMKALEQQFALERERTRIARDIHDDLGANLTQIGLLSALGRQQRSDPDAVASRFESISGTTAELVQSLDAIVWAVNPRHDSLESLARYLTRYAGDFCAHSTVRLRLDVPPQLPDAALSSELRHNIFLAVKEALNNALRHAGAEEIHLRLTAAVDHFTVSIADNGRGFTPNVGDAGEGLLNMHQRLADCGGACDISSAAGRGTTVQFTVPLPHPPAAL